MKPVQAVLLGIGIVVLAWASLFITVLNQSHKTNELLRNDHALLQQDNVILKAQRQTETDLEVKIADLQNHVDCLFNLATHPNHSTNYILDADQCTIASAPDATGSTSANAPQQQSKVFVSDSPSNNAPKQKNNQVENPPKPNVIQRVINKVKEIL